MKALGMTADVNFILINRYAAGYQERQERKEEKDALVEIAHEAGRVASEAGDLAKRAADIILPAAWNLIKTYGPVPFVGLAKILVIIFFWIADRFDAAAFYAPDVAHTIHTGATVLCDHVSKASLGFIGYCVEETARSLREGWMMRAEIIAAGKEEED